MSLFLFLTVVQAIIAAALVAVILMQRSEGGGLGIGGSPGGVMGARGSADFLTKSTRWLAVAFVAMSILLAAVAVETTGGSEITSDLDRSVETAPADPLSGQADPADAPVLNPSDGSDPLAAQAE